MDRHYDVVVIGGGIIGLAQAWMASERGLSVLLLERDSKACGASVRNFGMIWPIGQPAGKPHEIALRSRKRWMQLAASGVVELESCGSIHAAHNEDEWDVLQEFADLQTHPVELITKTEVIQRQPVVNPNGLYGGLYSDTELRVDPRVASAKIGAWLDAQPRITCRYDTPVVRVDYPSVQTGDGETWTADHIVICSGSDLRTLYGEVFRSSGLRLCKLQMLKTKPQNGIQPNTPHLASGLTLRHYNSFGACRSLERVKNRIKTESPELDHFGIHVMASVFPSGEIILGDSHEYDEAITPFDRSEIDQLMIRELRKLICLSDWTMAEHWHGIYAKHSDLLIFETLIDEGVHVFVGPGGAGMTMSFGLADDAWDRWL